ncbi:MAG: hypothetical protein M3Q98_12720, partial [Actinomycetota bacterium]|nr:hypothetical protein [Actinomycetota bacterium]
LEDEFAIRRRNLIDESNAADLALRSAIQEIWFEAHQHRRQHADRAEMSDDVSSRLVAHDVENCVGVIQLRNDVTRSDAGFRHWWLTLDRVAFDLKRRLAERLSGPVPSSPALSPDFLSQLLRLGPLRTAVELGRHAALPVVTTISQYESVPVQLIELADETRKRFEGQSERVVRRRVRDTLNQMRWKAGSEAQEGVRGAEERIKARLQAQAARNS